jgi:hydroxypyruvate isomerase
VADAIARAAGLIGHLQVADVPGRHEPGTGSLEWGTIVAALKRAGYHGAIGLEYRPTVGLGWIEELSLEG